MNFPTRAIFLFFGLLLSSPAFSFTEVNVSATKDLPCMADRDSKITNCTAGEFVVNATFSAADNTPPFCMSGEEFEFVVEVDLSESNANRYDIGFFVGQEGNSPVASTPSSISSTGLAQCSVATFPTSLSPWSDLETQGNNSDACGDYPRKAETTNIINEIKVICSANAASSVSTSALEVPYILTYVQNRGGLNCSGPADVVALSPSKCQSGAGYVNGVVAVEVGVWFDITKQTTPDQQSMTADGFAPQEFSYTATGPAGTKVMALVGATLTDSDVTGGTYIPASLDDATNTTTFTLSDGETARIFMTVDENDQTITVTEAATTGWEDTAESIVCSGGVAITSDTVTRTMTATLGTSAVSAACTITNIKQPTVQVEKVSEQDVGTFEFTGTNGWTTETITTTTASTPDTAPAVVTPTQSTVQLFSVGNAIDIAETANSDFRFKDVECLDYLPTYYGSSATNVGTVDATNAAQIGLSSVEMQAGAEILCTYTSVRQRDLSVTKVLNDPFQPGLFVLNANGTDSVEGGDGTTVLERVDVASTVTASEVVGTSAIASDPDTGDIFTDMANYNASFSCDTVPATTAVASGSGTSTSFTMPNNDITCTFTNDRKSADLILTKQWAVGFENDEVSLASSGFVNNASLASSVSSATGDNTDSGAASTVYVGETATLAENWTTGNSDYYNTSISCSGTDGLTDATLTVGQDDTAIDCTFTNTRKSANLVLQKQWVNSDNGSVIRIGGSGFSNDAAVTHTSTSAGDNLTTSDPVTVYILESGTLAESWGAASTTGLDLSDFEQALSCTGTAGFDASTNTLTIGVDDTDITCTFTNEQLKPRLQLVKTNQVIWDPVNESVSPKAIPGSLVEYTIEVENSGLGSVGQDSMVLTDAIPDNLHFYVSGSEGGATPPLQVQEGSISTGLSLSDSEVEYSVDNGSSWTETPTENVTHVRVSPPGVMEGRSDSGNPSFEVKFWVVLE